MGPDGSLQKLKLHFKQNNSLCQFIIENNWITPRHQLDCVESLILWRNWTSNFKRSEAWIHITVLPDRGSWVILSNQAVIFCSSLTVTLMRFLFPDLEAELQQVNISEPWSFRRSCWFDPSPSGPQPYRLYRTILLLWTNLLKTPAAGGKPPQRHPPSYLHNDVSTRKFLDLWTQVRI